MSRDWVAFLVDDIDDLLVFGRVGVYEFFEALRSVDAPPPESE